MDKPSFYLYLHKKLEEHTEPKLTTTIADAKAFIGNAYNIPKPLRIVIIYEMENAGLITIVDRENIKIKPKASALLNNTSKLYRAAGCW